MIHQETPLNIDLEINNKRQDCKIDSVVDTCGRGEGEWRRLRWGSMVDGLHIQNRTMKPLATALSVWGGEMVGAS
jgi:hypothetical protein